MLSLDETGLQWDKALELLPEGKELGKPEYLVKKLDPAEVLGE